jgi:hypothetical protein
MNEKSLLTLKQIADEIGVNYRPFIGCKNRFEGFIHGVPVGRIAKYPEDIVDFFRMVFALFDEGYSTEQVRNLLLNGVECEEDAFIESWLEEWRTSLQLNLSNQEEMASLVDGPAGGPTDGPTDGRTDRPMDGPMDERIKTEVFCTGPEHPPFESGQNRTQTGVPVIKGGWFLNGDFGWFLSRCSHSKSNRSGGPKIKE